MIKPHPYERSWTIRTYNLVHHPIYFVLWPVEAHYPNRFAKFEKLLIRMTAKVLVSEIKLRRLISDRLTI